MTSRFDWVTYNLAGYPRNYVAVADDRPDKVTPPVPRGAHGPRPQSLER